MLDDIFLALSHPTRRAILQHLLEDEATVNELVGLFELTQPSISNHLRVLERAGLVTRSRDAQYRPVQINRAAVSAASHWLTRFS